MDKALITIITVCYNASKTIVDTMESVLIQSYKNIEYIIIDGNSTDNTVELISSYIERFRHEGITVKWKSEKDNGIQDAYNKAMRMATGEWYIFINSGDQFYTLDVLKNFLSKLGSVDADIVYGDIMLSDVMTGKMKKHIYKDILDLKFFLKNTICHQSIFFRNTMFKLYGEYDTEYRIASDFDRLFVFFINGAKYFHIDEVISIFVNDGVSSLSYKKSNLERIAIIKKRMGKISFFNILTHYYFMLKCYIYNVKNLIVHKK